MPCPARAWASFHIVGIQVSKKENVSSLGYYFTIIHFSLIRYISSKFEAGIPHAKSNNLLTNSNYWQKFVQFIVRNRTSDSSTVVKGKYLPNLVMYWPPETTTGPGDHTTDLARNNWIGGPMLAQRRTNLWQTTLDNYRKGLDSVGLKLFQRRKH